MPEIEYDIVVFQEGDQYVGYCPELDVSSCGRDIEQARRNAKTAVRLFVEEAERMGTLEEILEECGYEQLALGAFRGPRLVATEVASVPVGV